MKFYLEKRHLHQQAEIFRTCPFLKEPLLTSEYLKRVECCSRTTEAHFQGQMTVLKLILSFATNTHSSIHINGDRLNSALPCLLAREKIDHN